jgi:hypothetical protein
VQGSHFYAGVRAEIPETRQQSGLPNVRWHDQRHFCATQLLELGLDHFTVSVQLGHEDGGALVMARYGHPSKGRCSEAATGGVHARRRGRSLASLVAVLTDPAFGRPTEQSAAFQEPRTAGAPAVPQRRRLPNERGRCVPRTSTRITCQWGIWTAGLLGRRRCRRRSLRRR